MAAEHFRCVSCDKPLDSITFCPKELTGVFLQMKDPDYFKRAFVDPETKTVGWPNVVDIDPYTLYEPPLGKPGNREQTQQGGASIAAEG